MFLLPKLHVHISDHMISEVVANIEILNFSILAELFEDILIEILEVLLQLARIRLLDISMLIYAAVKASVRRLIHIRQQQSLTSGRPVVKPRAAVAMATNANLKVKRTIDTILLCPENGRQMLRHGSSKPKISSKTKPKALQKRQLKTIKGRAPQGRPRV